MKSRFLIEIFSEESPSGVGKFSAKRAIGITVGVLAATGSMLSGLEFYDIGEEIINPMWIFSGTMLGVSVIKNLKKS